MYDIVMAEEAFDRFTAYTDLCTAEIAAFGYVTPVAVDKRDGFLYVEDIFLVPQEVSGASVDFMSEGLPFAIKKATADGKLDQLRFCVHSHVNMDAYFSGIDEDMIAKIGTTGTPWFASAVFNKKGKTDARVDVFGHDLGLPGIGRKQITVPARVLREGDDNDALYEQCAEDIKEFVTKRKFVYKGSTKRKAGEQTQPKSKKHEPDESSETVYIGDGHGNLIPATEIHEDRYGLGFPVEWDDPDETARQLAGLPDDEFDGMVIGPGGEVLTTSEAAEQWDEFSRRAWEGSD